MLIYESISLVLIMSDRLLIRGKQCLNGEIKISGAKNAALPLCAAAILSSEKLILKNVPNLTDVDTMISLLKDLGTNIESSDIIEGNMILQICATNINKFAAEYDLVKKMRASILILGAMLAKHGKCSVSMPGGCSIGIRPINLHLKAMEALGATITLENGYINATATNGLTGTKFIFPVVSVTGTENMLMAATLAKGETTIMNAACEPEVVDLANCLISMGAKITGHGTPTIVIEGVKELHGATHTVIPDRIEAGSYAAAAAITKGNVKLISKGLVDMMSSVISVLSNIGLDISEEVDGISVKYTGDLKGVNVSTKPFPGFPTDMQAQIMALLCLAGDVSIITENIWENRFMHVPELVRMGADITVYGPTAVIKKVNQLKGARVSATDLRAAFGLVIAALAAEGETTIDNLYHLDRGYADVEKKLKKCGVIVERVC